MTERLFKVSESKVRACLRASVCVRYPVILYVGGFHYRKDRANEVIKKYNSDDYTKSVMFIDFYLSQFPEHDLFGNERRSLLNHPVYNFPHDTLTQFIHLTRGALRYCNGKRRY